MESRLPLVHDIERLQSLITDKIHYGCGTHILKNWFNVDGFEIQSFPDSTIDRDIAAQIYPVDLSSMHPFPDNYFRFGFSEDFLEHLDQAESLIFLAESYRTFAKNGVLRLSFPDLRNVLRRHYRSADYEGATKGRNDAYIMWSHKHFYCFESLQLVAKHIGYRDMKVVEFGKSDYEVLKNLETRRDQIDLNLTVELIK